MKTTGQSKVHSVLEVGLNLSIGFMVAAGFVGSFKLAVAWISCSLIKYYFVRRLFNWLHLRKNK